MMWFTLRHWLGLATVVVALALFWMPMAEAKDSAYSRYTAVVYNKNFPGSDHVARHYLTVRSIPSSNLIALDCPITEEITRAQYENTIAGPLRKIFVDKEWWTVDKAAGGSNRVTDNAIKVITLIYGIPLKIKDTREPLVGATPAQVQTWQRQSDGASVDSELCLLGSFATSFDAHSTNPYFRQVEAFGDVQLPEMMLVGRVDGGEHLHHELLVKMPPASTATQPKDVNSAVGTRRNSARDPLSFQVGLLPSALPQCRASPKIEQPTSSNLDK